MTFVSSVQQPAWTKAGNLDGSNWRSLMATAKAISDSGRDGAIDLMGRPWVSDGSMTDAFDCSRIREIDGSSGGSIVIDLTQAAKAKVDTTKTDGSLVNGMLKGRLEYGIRVQQPIRAASRADFGKSNLFTLNNVLIDVVDKDQQGNKLTDGQGNELNLTKLIFLDGSNGSPNQEFASVKTIGGWYRGADYMVYHGPNAGYVDLNGGHAMEFGALAGRGYESLNSMEQFVARHMTLSAFEWFVSHQWGVNAEMVFSDCSFDYPQQGYVNESGGGIIKIIDPHMEGRTTYIKGQANPYSAPPFMLDNDTQLIIVRPNLSWTPANNIGAPSHPFYIWGDGARGGSITVIDPWENPGFDWTDPTQLCNKPDQIKFSRGYHPHGVSVDLGAKATWNMNGPGWNAATVPVALK